MAYINVQANKGSKVYSKPRGGVLIPRDKPIMLLDSPWLRRLADFYGDVEITPFDPPKAQAASPPPFAREEPTVIPAKPAKPAAKQ